MDSRVIRVIGARQHNLRDISLTIPRDQLVVITGLSGSGKSSLAFDTIYAEGRRKYVESLSVHARYFLEQLSKPDVDHIEGLPPTLAIEQSSAGGSSNPRSIVATATEIYDFLRLLFARVGEPYCPNCDKPIRRHTIDQIVDAVSAAQPGTRVMILAPVLRGGDDAAAVLKRIQREGFVRARADGRLLDLRELVERAGGDLRDIDVVIDRIVARGGAVENRRRIADAIELALTVGDGRVIVSQSRTNVSGGDEAWEDEQFSERFACRVCGFSIEELSPRMFSFNSPYGACERCSGLGTEPGFDPQLIVPDEDKSLMQGAIAPWPLGSKGMGATFTQSLRELCAAFGARPETPYRELPEAVRSAVLHGLSDEQKAQFNIDFEGVIPNLARRSATSRKQTEGERWSEYQSDCPCPACHGRRLKPAARAVRIGPHGISDIVSMTIERAFAVADDMRFDGEAAQIAQPIVGEIRQRLKFLNDVGLGYLTLDRPSATLSGGEAQRIRLATQLGSGLVGVCYVLDEPTIGLHQRDNERLLRSIRRLVDLGNTVIAVEHDEDVIRAADYLVELGPGAGLHGGKLLASGPTAQVLADPRCITAKYLREDYSIPLPDRRRPAKKDWFVDIRGARENNLQNIDVRIPLGMFVAVTGVSGAGKSTLVSQILVPALRRRFGARPGAEGSPRRQVGAHERLLGAHRIDALREIDQTPIGRTPRSNPATYTGVFDEIRRLYAMTKEARIRGYHASRFSFNAKGGRCEACQGQGTRRIEMHFLPDVFVDCQECKGARYNRETLDVRYRGKSIADVLSMRVEEAIKFFDSFQKIRVGLQALSDVGLGYIELGQPSNTLSGGEAERVKLAAELARPAGINVIPEDGAAQAVAAQRARSSSHTMYVLDEPTTGLHFADIQTLLAVLNRLVDMGNTVLVVEHNLDVIKCADWVIDLGPDGGQAGGNLVAEGTPESVAACGMGYTGAYLAPKLLARPADSA
ncbi:MAG: excinuclease ABC subunit UvrA [Phycisphaerales bacterium]|nr:excinuclease ABC subunit UvrA [Phycisphaerales bacterium]